MFFISTIGFIGLNYGFIKIILVFINVKWGANTTSSGANAFDF